MHVRSATGEKVVRDGLPNIQSRSRFAVLVGITHLPKLDIGDDSVGDMIESYVMRSIILLASIPPLFLDYIRPEDSPERKRLTA